MRLNSIKQALRTTILIYAGVACLNATARLQDLPKLKGFFNDYAVVMSPMEAVDIERTLSEYDSDANIQIVVVTIKETGIEDLKTFTQRLWSKYKIAEVKKYENRGALIVINTVEKSAAIKVHPAVKSRLTDYVANEIISSCLLPEIEKGNYFRGILQTIAEVRTRLVEAEGVDSATEGNILYIFLGILLGSFALAALIFLFRKRSKN
ncbi:MAG: hypothetical protein Kow0090_11980 [Myxococcota bacterium]